jgi:acyl carrier protein
VTASTESIVIVRAIPNARVSEPLVQWRHLAVNRSNGVHPSPVDPEAFAQSLETAGYHVTLAVNPDKPGTFDAVVARNTIDSRTLGHAPVGANDRPRFNEPLQAGRLRQLATQVRGHLEKSLPPYMMPNRIVPLASIPKTASGKPDRRALAALDDGLTTNRPYTAPRTELEEAIVRLWESLLDADRIGVHDNFFELGGHSLMATQFAAQVAEAYGVDVPLRAFFSDPTPAGAASAVEDALMREIENLSEDEAARLVAS